MKKNHFIGQSGDKITFTITHRTKQALVMIKCCCWMEGLEKTNKAINYLWYLVLRYLVEVGLAIFPLLTPFKLNEEDDSIILLTIF